MEPWKHALAEALRRTTYEVLPMRRTEDEVLAHVPEGVGLTVTTTQARGLEATVELAVRLAKNGYRAVPHLAARLVSDDAHLVALLDRMADEGLSEAFVVAGDSPRPAGEFPDALSLLRRMHELGRRPARVGITGYPERHAFIPDHAAVQAMNDKAGCADYVVSQICYDPATIASWVKAVRARGIALPIHIGVPGVVDVTKLLRISLKIGLGESMRFLRKQHGVVSRLLTRYTPDELFDELSPYLVDPSEGIAGWHFFTFNEVAKTVEWRGRLAAELGEVPA